MKLTKKSLQNLKQKLEELKDRRKKIAKRLRKTAAYGDISDNAEYDQAKRDKAFLEGKILELKNLIREAEIVESGAGQGVVIGSQVVVKEDQDGEQQRELQIVSSPEADPLEGKISADSPLGEALLGKKKGDKVEITTPQGETEYQILKILYGPK